MNEGFSHIGFTGTRIGMTTRQKEVVDNILQGYSGNFFHHGDCVGADDEAANLACAYGMKIVVHPPIDTTHRAHNKAPAYAVRAPKTHFSRNRDIVDDCDTLIVAPIATSWQSRGGTWMTHDYGVKMKKNVIVCWPNGTITGPAKKE